MKTLLHILVALIVMSVTVENIQAQNLVPNPSFEDTVQCPTNGWIINASNWEPFSSSPNYYNSCVDSFFFGYSVPNNFTGFQPAASGQAYAGGFCYIEGETNYSLNREIIGRDLVMPLSLGQKYFVSFKTVAVPFTSNIGSSMHISKLGALFSTVPYTNIDSTTIPPIKNFAHIYTDSIITDTTNWTTIFGSFTADSTYGYISIGNFFENDSTDTLHIANNPFTPTSYYLFDDICVSTDSSFCANYIYTGINEEQESNNITIYPNPASGYVNVEFDDNIEHIITIYNSTGQIVISKTIIGQATINIESLSQGIYYMKTRSNNNPINKKLIIY